MIPMLTRFVQWLFRPSVCRSERGSADIKCPHCNKWYTESHQDGPIGLEDMYDWGYRWTCCNCKSVSYWNAIAAPVLLRCDEQGTPYVKRKEDTLKGYATGDRS